MRSILISLIFIANLANAARAEYEEVRKLTLETEGISSLNVDAGAGSLAVYGETGISQITVIATIQVPGRDDEKALRKIDKNMILSLDRNGAIADLDAWFEHGIWSFGKGPTIHLEVHMPAQLGLAIEDGTGSIEVENVRGDVYVDDGTGSLVMNGVGGNVEIEDGTGSITVTDVGGDISVDDGTGGIEIQGVAGSVTIDDGTGSIDVADVANDLLIVDSGTGGVDYSNIGGRIETD